MNIGIVGSGKIVPFHLDALRAAGFSLGGISSSVNSVSARNLAHDYGIEHYFKSTDDMFNHIQLFDALLLAPTSKFLYGLLRKSCSAEVPVLVEKPVFTTIQQISEFDHFAVKDNLIQVGYNRRFYQTILYLREKIKAHGLSMMRLSVPELSFSRSISQEERAVTVIENSVHMLDLFIHLSGVTAGELAVEVIKFRSGNPVVCLGARAMQCNITFGAPGNYSIEAITEDGILLILKPLESLFEFSDMEVIQPDSQLPFRRYLPQLTREISAFEGNLKPGFLGQAKSFMSLIKSQESDLVACSLREATEVSRLAFQISKLLD